MIDLLAGLVSFLVLGGIIAIFAAGISFWLSTKDRPLALHRRALRSALAASGVMFLVPLVVIAVEGFEWEIVIIGAAMLAVALFMAAVFGYPSAYLLGKRMDARGSSETAEPD